MISEFYKYECVYLEFIPGHIISKYGNFKKFYLKIIGIAEISIWNALNLEMFSLHLHHFEFLLLLHARGKWYFHFLSKWFCDCA